PWFVRVLLGIGAWVAAFLFIVFLFLARVILDKTGALVTGIILLGLATFIRRQTSNDFLVQMMLALCLASQVLILFGIVNLSENKLLTAAAALLLQALVIVIFPGVTARFLAALGCVGALAAFAYEAHLPYGLDVLAVVLAFALAIAWCARP